MKRKKYITPPLQYQSRQTLIKQRTEKNPDTERFLEEAGSIEYRFSVLDEQFSRDFQMNRFKRDVIALEAWVVECRLKGRECAVIPKE